jgi:hypothetical protein
MLGNFMALSGRRAFNLQKLPEWRYMSEEIQPTNLSAKSCSATRLQAAMDLTPCTIVGGTAEVDYDTVSLAMLRLCCQQHPSTVLSACLEGQPHQQI